MKFLTHAIVFSVFFLSLIFQSHAQENFLLWQISGKGLTDTSYLFGTIHIRDKRVFDLGDSTYYAIKHTKALFGELDLQDKDAMKGHASEFMMPAGISLESLLTPEEYQQVKKYCKKHLGVYALLMNKIKPIYLSAVVSEDILRKD
jgi:uncharacterized protein YbaP (TraB family)